MSTKPPSLWRPKSYPFQSSTHDSPSPTSPPSTTLDKPLPPILRATRNSLSSPAGRTIVICLDGTGDKFDNDNSNVVNFVACLKKDDPNQITYYQSGIGTYDGHGLTRGFSAAVDMAVGSGLGVHVKDAYMFLMENYREGDKICLLGFSRGSYTVRCLAGMLHKVGLLPAQNSAQVSFAYNFYKNDTPEGWSMSADFKKTFCTNVSVYYVGIWDCVASVGFIPRRLPFSKSPTKSIHYFRHAMALDEHRAKFKVCQWQHADPAAIQREEKKKGVGERWRLEVEREAGVIKKFFSSCFGSSTPSSASPSQAEKPPSVTSQTTALSSSTISALKRNITLPLAPISHKIQAAREKENQDLLESQFENYDTQPHSNINTDVLEVWFLGAHADVGGGAVHNDTRHQLSRIPLRWMLRQCFECDTGILFSTSALAETGIDVESLYPVYKPYKKPVCGPKPSHVEKYESGTLASIKRRSTALSISAPITSPSNPPYDPENPDITAHEHAYILSPSEKERLEKELLPEQVEDHFDAMAPINDQLVQAKGWWILEFWPVKVRVQKKKDGSEEWEKRVRMNMGRYRAVRELEPNMHWTVETRMGERGYRLRNVVDREAVWTICC